MSGLVTASQPPSSHISPKVAQLLNQNRWEGENGGYRKHSSHVLNSLSPFSGLGSDLFFCFFFLRPSACAGMWEADQISLAWAFASAASSSRTALIPSRVSGKRWTDGRLGMTGVPSPKEHNNQVLQTRHDSALCNSIQVPCGSLANLDQNALLFFFFSYRFLLFCFYLF